MTHRPDRREAGRGLRWDADIPIPAPRYLGLSTPISDTRQQDLLALTPLIRRVVAARVRDPQVVEDLVQETFARLLQAGPRLDNGALAPFAVVLARNVAVSYVRGRSTEARHLHRLVELAEPDRPDERALRQEEARAVTEGLARLPARDRSALVANEVEGADTATLAAEFGSTPGAVAAQLARARAKLRVNYLLAFRGVDLPTGRCRSVLNALSAGDRRRQRALNAGGHLLDCEVCASLSEPLTERRRALAGLLPLGLVKPLEGLRAWVRNHPGQATAGTGAVVGAALLAAQLLGGQPSAAAAGGGADHHREPGRPLADLRGSGDPAADRPAAAVPLRRRPGAGPGRAGAAGRRRRGLLGGDEPAGPGLGPADRHPRVPSPGPAGRPGVLHRPDGRAPARVRPPRRRDRQ